MRRMGTGCCNRPGSEPCEVRWTTLQGKQYERQLVCQLRCGGCGAPTNSPHHLGCDHERCPVCNEQVVLGCECMYVRTVTYQTATGEQVEE